MKGRSVIKTLGLIACFILLLAVVLIAFYHKAAYVVFRNLTVPVYRIDGPLEWENGATYERVPYAADSRSQYLDLYVPEETSGGKPKLFVLVHGGGFVAGDSQTKQVQLMYRYFRDRGYACASVNYRLAQEAQFPAGLSDCKAAIRFLRAHADEYGFDAERIVLWGESAGGYLAVMCAVTNDEEFNDVKFIGEDMTGGISSKVDVLVDYYGHIDNKGTENDWKALGIPQLVFDIANSWISEEVPQGFDDCHSFWLRKNVSDMTIEEYTAADPYFYIDENMPADLSVWIVHGDCDITVPYLESERLAETLSGKLGQDAVSYHLIPGMGHASDPLYSDQLLGELDEFLKTKEDQDHRP